MPAIKGLSFFADGERYAADVALVEKIGRKLKVTPVPAAPEEVAGITNLKGMVVTVMSVSALLGRGQSARAEPGPWRSNVVIFKPAACGGDQMGLLTEGPGSLIEIDEDKIAPLRLAEGEAGAEAGGPPLISGVFESGGALYRIIHVDSIISRFREGGRGAAPRPQGGTVDEETV